MTKSGRSRYELTEKKILAREKEGRGLGSGAAYKPWIYVTDLSSKGLSVRAHGQKTGRIHHLLSDLEVKAFHFFDADPDVLDIREQFPLSREITKVIADAVGVAHPAVPRSEVLVVMTTDFLIDRVSDSGGTERIAVSCKYSGEASTLRFAEKFEIERRYWRTKSIRLVLFDEYVVNRHMQNNLQTAHAYSDLAMLSGAYEGYYVDGASAMLAALQSADRDAEIRQVWDEVSATSSVDRSDCANLFWHLVGCGLVRFNNQEMFSARAPISTLQVLEGGLRAH